MKTQRPNHRRSATAFCVFFFFASLTVSSASPGGEITMEPQDAFVVRGNPLRLIAEFRPYGQTVFGYLVAYQWLFQSSPGGSVTLVKSGLWRGGEPFELLIPNATESHAGRYRITFQNKAGAPFDDLVLSRWATVTVGGTSGVTPLPPLVIPPSITRQPQGQAATAGASVSFSVATTGTEPVSYQWRKNGVNISGANSASYTIANVQTSHAGAYSVVVSNTAGSATSASATLTVSGIPPGITLQPQSQSVTTGASVVFSITATGPGPLA